MAEHLMGDNGVNIKKLFNFLGDLKADIESVTDKAFDLEFELNSHICNHD